MAEFALKTKPWNYNIEYIGTARETYALSHHIVYHDHSNHVINLDGILVMFTIPTTKFKRINTIVFDMIYLILYTKGISIYINKHVCMQHLHSSVTC